MPVQQLRRRRCQRHSLIAAETHCTTIFIVKTLAYTILRRSWSPIGTVVPVQQYNYDRSPRLDPDLACMHLTAQAPKAASYCNRSTEHKPNVWLLGLQNQGE